MEKSVNTRNTPDKGHANKKSKQNDSSYSYFSDEYEYYSDEEEEYSYEEENKENLMGKRKSAQKEKEKSTNNPPKLIIQDNNQNKPVSYHVDDENLNVTPQIHDSPNITEIDPKILQIDDDTNKSTETIDKNNESNQNTNINDKNKIETKFFTTESEIREPETSKMHEIREPPRKETKNTNEFNLKKRISNMVHKSEVKSIHEPENTQNSGKHRPGVHKRRKVVYRNESTVNETRINELKEQSMKRKISSKVTQEEYDTLLNKLEEERNSFSDERKFDESMKIQRAINYVENKRRNEIHQEIEHEKKKRREESIKNIKEEITLFDKKTKEMLKELEHKHKEQEEILLKTHEEEFKDLETEWSSEHKVRMYNRPSARLLSLMKQLEYLVIHNQFDSASSLQKTIDIIRCEEERNAGEIMQRAFDNAVHKKEERNRIEIENLHNKQRLEISQLKSQRNIDKKPLIYKLHNVNIKKDIQEDNLIRNKSTTRIDRIPNQKQNTSRNINFSTKVNPQLLNLPKLVLRVSTRQEKIHSSKP
ncbi:hypothetical protein TVAG_181280 [Trichomonas vaginalis G3]|uniref:Uncharacterized protein n=1 Tax=Trichomonas vaginalis (strain ATCC PRA-98 / G3) TaxID=412133 RepID=A2FP32_TRIV3|nr:hypothetical protein TVAGG3_0753670 [Trichomonas vaginalis G3]EAX93335.1 hypothetical protein TVAG_181280 [Trichomonas vaginalis G3]KAI5512715.1 hypothetical protein TVAGG3_0753670 [Trichomonas vaginalis G3]|eukprot:XP_001306265.1 hypothetical protein [Trichomonas vaginalis G3]